MRFQRVPPTEKRGRVHTSTVTIAIISNDIVTNPIYDLKDEVHFRVEWFSGTGKGGQHRNKHMNSCRVYHIPTGLMESRQSRSRTNNFAAAKEALLKTLCNAKNLEQNGGDNIIRKGQVGTGGRDDKIRTYKFQEDTVVDHTTDKKFNLKQIFRGNFDKFWE